MAHGSTSLPGSTAGSPSPFVDALSAAASPLAAAAPSPVPPPATAPAVMAPAMVEYLHQLEVWALANEKDSRRDSLKFWSLKIPAMVAASSSGIFATVHMPPFISLLIGLVGGFCVALDGILRPGKLRSVHIRALHDLRNLQNIVRNQWLIATLEGRNSDISAAKILLEAEVKRLRIAAYLEAVEAAPLDSVAGGSTHEKKQE